MAEDNKDDENRQKWYNIIFMVVFGIVVMLLSFIAIVYFFISYTNEIEIIMFFFVLLVLGIISFYFAIAKPESIPWFIAIYTIMFFIFQISIEYPLFILPSIMMLFIGLLFISAFPLIRLKYHNDIAESAYNMTLHCYKNLDTDYLPENHKYIYHMCTYLYDGDFKAIKKDNKTYDTGVDELTEDKKNQNRKISKEFDYMPLYSEYLNHSIGVLLFSILFAFFYGYLFNRFFSEPYITWSLLGTIIFLVVLYIIIFSIILKKITEIYNDTKLFKYYNMMSKLNEYIKRYKNKSDVSAKDFNELIATITYNNKDVYYSDKDDQNYAKNLVLNNDTITYILDKLKCIKSPCSFDKYICNSVITDRGDGFKTYEPKCILEDYLEQHPYLHSKKHTDAVKFRVNTVISFLIAYTIFAFFLIYFFFKMLNELLAVNLVYIYAYIIIAYLLAIMIYFIIISIQQS